MCMGASLCSVNYFQSSIRKDGTGKLSLKKYSLQLKQLNTKSTEKC